MKKLVTITGAPTTTPMIVKDATLQIGKIAIIWAVTHTIFKVIGGAIEKRENEALLEFYKKYDKF